MATKTENLLYWLRDARAMEQQAEQMLKAQASRIEHYPKLKTRIEQHLEETQGQREWLEGCLQHLGEKPLMLKDIADKLTACDHETQRVCETILPQEEAMSAWVKDHLPELTDAFLTRSEAPDIQAKR